MQKEVLNLSVSKGFKNLLNVAEKAFKKLYKNKGYSPKDLSDTKEYQDLINQTNAFFDKTIVENVVDGALLKNLQNDVFLFSSLKTHAQLFEASRLLLNAENKIKPFSDFYKDILKINETYNRQYLEAEYQFAIASSQIANKWADFSEDYNLQYRTAGDQRVRDSHDVLRDTTLPKADPFWDSFMPPNGWRCRCTVVEVLPEDYTVSNSKTAIAKGETATSQIGKDGKNKLAIFRFNPGKDKVIFPPNHPYNKVAGASVVKETLLKDKKNELKTLRKEKDSKIKEWANSKIKKNEFLSIKAEQFKTLEVRVSRSNIDYLLKHIGDINKKEIIKDLQKVIKQSKFTNSAELDKSKNSKNYGSKVARGVLSYNYYKSMWNDKEVEINMEVMKDGYEQPYAILFDKK